MLKGYFETRCECLHYQMSLVKWRRHFKLSFNYFIATSISLGNNSGFEFFTSENWLIQKLESNFSHAGKVQTFSLLYKSYIVLYPHVLQLHIHVCLNQGQLWAKESIWRLFHKNFELCLWKKKSGWSTGFVLCINRLGNHPPNINEDGDVSDIPWRKSSPPARIAAAAVSAWNETHVTLQHVRTTLHQQGQGDQDVGEDFEDRVYVDCDYRDEQDDELGIATITPSRQRDSESRVLVQWQVNCCAYHHHHHHHHHHPHHHH